MLFFLTDIEFWKTISVKVKFDISQNLADWYRIGVDWYEGVATETDPISVKNHISQNLLTDIKKMFDWYELTDMLKKLTDMVY